MYQGFKKVIIIEPRTDVGRLIRDVVKELGAVDAVITESVKDAWTFMQTADSIPDWIIATVDQSPRFHILNLLQLLLTNPEFSDCRVSLIVTDDDMSILPLAFDLGALSYHKKPFTKSQLQTSFTGLLKNLSPDKDQHYDAAAEFLRAYLNEKDDFSSRIRLDKSLINKFSKETKYYLSLAEAQILAEKQDDARKTLGIAKHLGMNLTLGVKQLNDLLDPAQGGEPTIAEAFSINNALIIDPDNTAAKAVEKALEGLGIKTIAIVGNGEEAITWLKANGEPSLLLSEWKVPKISGPALVQRIRQMGMINLPIIIQSSLVKNKDKNLLKEIGVSAVMSKPIMVEELVTEIVSVFQSDRMAQSSQDMERKIRQLLDTKKTKEAEKLYEEFVKQPGIPNGIRLLVDATIKFHSGKYPEARDAALEALKEKGEAVVILNLLSKIFLKLNDKESALKCLNRAQEYSSDNLERLILMAEVHSGNGDEEQARKAIDDAKKVDATNDMVIQAEAEVAITMGDHGAAKDIIGHMDSAMNLIANMNNRAVLLVSGGEVDKALTLYRNALESLPQKMTSERDIISYNMSLAYARCNKQKEAQELLATTVKNSQNKAMIDKAKSLLTRVEKAIASKQEIKLNVSTEAKPPEVKAAPVRPTALHLQPGQLCLHGLFDASDKYTDDVRKIIETCPVFNRVKQATLTRTKAS